MGALMGFQMAMAKQMTPERMSLLMKFMSETGTKSLTPMEKDEADKQCKVFFEKTVPDINIAAQQALMGSMNLPQMEMGEFMRGFQVGIQGASIESFLAHQEFTTIVYNHLLWGWRVVEKLESVTELRNWLLQRLPEIHVGSETRIKKLCLRIGLKLRGRGRPRKVGK
jgi:hypothetical protein